MLPERVEYDDGERCAKCGSPARIRIHSAVSEKSVSGYKQLGSIRRPWVCVDCYEKPEKAHGTGA